MLADRKVAADWISIILQFAFDAIFGGAVALIGVIRNGVIYRVTDYRIYCLILPAATAIGALAALFGDKFYGDRAKCIPSAEIKHTGTSKLLCWTIFLLSVFFPLAFFALKKT